MLRRRNVRPRRGELALVALTEDSAGGAWLDGSHGRCGNNGADGPRHGGGGEVWRDRPGHTPGRGGAWTCTEASQARARPPFCLRPVCHLSNTRSDGTMVLADQTPWVFHTWMLTMACLSIALADHEAPPPPVHWPSPQAQTPWGHIWEPRSGKGQSGPGLDHRSSPLVESNPPGDLRSAQARCKRRAQLMPCKLAQRQSA